MTVIFEARNCGTASNNHWKVELLDEPGRIPGLIRFHMQTRMATRLDQVAQWLPEGRWAAGRWRPDPPTVPKWLIARVEAALQQGVACDPPPPRPRRGRRITTPNCSNCSTPVQDPAERWPDESKGTLCQCCWEAYSSRLWWVAVHPLLILEAR